MPYAQTWSTDSVRAVMTTESRQKSRELFLNTHRPFNRIRVDFCKERTTASFICEDELRSMVHAGRLRDDNRLFFIVGEAGCGKSELCQWLEYTADSESRIAVHIPRSMTSVTGVVRLLREKLGLVTPTAPLHATPVAMQAQLIALSALTQWYEVGVHELPASQPWDRILVAPNVLQAVADYLKQIAESHIPPRRIIDASVLASACVEQDLLLEDTCLDGSVAAVHELLMKAMERIMWAGDVRALLRDLSASAVESGRRPLLLIEDITAFQTLGDMLLDYLLDLTSGHMDAVIGVTTGFERSQLPRATLSGDLTHVHHRLRARLVLSDEHGHTYGLDEDLIEFARSYLRATKDADSDSVAQRTPPGFDPDLYPFTQTALRRAFAQLEEDGNSRQTPRLFIEHVLAAALLAPEPPPAVLEASRYLRRPPSHVRREAVPDAALSSLVRWYADVDDAYVTLDVRIPAAWGIHIPEQSLRDGLLKLPRTYVARSLDTPAPGPERDYELAELQQWLDCGGRYPSRETLKRAIERVIRNIGDPRSLGSLDSISQNRAELYYARGDERLPIVLEDGSGDVDYPGGAVAIHVTRLPEERPVLEELALGELTGAPLVDVCQNVSFTLNWARRHFDTYQRDLRVEFSRRLHGLEVDELIVLSWKLVSVLCGVPWEDVPHLEALVAPTMISETVGPWERVRHPACFATGTTLLNWREEIRGLFVGTFALHDTFLDTTRFRSTANRMDTAQALERIAAIPSNTLGSLPFKIKPGGTALQQLLIDLQRYAQAILQLDVPKALTGDLDELASKVSHLEATCHTDLDALRTRLTELRERCNALGISWQMSWDDDLAVFRDLQPEHLVALLENTLVQLQLGTALRTAGGDVWAYQAWRLTAAPLLVDPYWAALQRVVSIQEEALLVAKRRTPRARKLLTGTREYRELLTQIHAFVQEVRSNDTLPPR